MATSGVISKGGSCRASPWEQRTSTSPIAIGAETRQKVTTLARTQYAGFNHAQLAEIMSEKECVALGCSGVVATSGGECRRVGLGCRHYAPTYTFASLMSCCRKWDLALPT